MQQDRRREAPRPRTAYHWTPRSWCEPHEGFEVEPPVTSVHRRCTVGAPWPRFHGSGTELVPSFATGS
eukprot:1404858-Prymnesium_polylepis.1